MEPVTVRATAPSLPGDPMLKQTETIKGEQDGIGDLVHRLIDDAKAYATAEVGYYKALGTERSAPLRCRSCSGCWRSCSRMPPFLS